MYPVALEERIRESQVIFEGEVLGSRSFWNLNRTQIYTAHLVKVYKLFKGSIRGSTAVIVTEGGVVGNRMLEVYPALKLSEGQKGIFMLIPWGEPTPFENLDAFITYADEQGFIELDYFNDQGREPFYTYSSIQEDVYNRISVLVGSPYSIIQEREQPQKNIQQDKRNMATSPFTPTNITFTPTSITAGTGSVLTINGNNFGTLSGSAKVQFKDADDGGATWVDVPNSYITSWTNTQITLIVPNKATGGTPGTGQVRVVDASNQQGTSTATLTITYNIINTNAGHLIRLYNENGSGGYTFRYNTNFASLPARIASFRRALESWRCATFVNFGEQCAPTSTVTCQDQNDNINIVSMDATSCALPSGVLGKCYSSFVSPGTCPASMWFVDDLDIIFKSSVTWQYGPALATGAQFDFESVALHELGHAHQLGHVINNTIVMHYALGSGQNLRTLNPASDIAGGNYVMSQSTSFTVCSPSFTPMISVNTSTCGLTPNTNFTAIPNTLCQNQNTTISLTNPTTGASYAWNFGAGANPANSSTVGPHSVSWSTNGTKTITVNATHNGCISINEVVVTVSSGAGATANIISPPSAACVNQTITLNATAGPPGTTYNWTCSGCTPAPGNTHGPINISWSTPGAKVVNLSVTAPGCPTPATQSITINVTNPVSATITSPVSSSACINQNVTFQANSGGGTNYNWDCDGCSPALGNTEGPFTASWSTTGTKTITLTINVPGCVNSTATMVVTVNNPPTANVTGPNTTCVDQAISVTGSGTGAGVTYGWACDGCTSSPPLGTTTGTFNLSWSTSGTKTVTLTANQHGCNSVSHSLIITVSSGAAAAITQPTNNTNACVNQILPLQAVSGAATYTWACDGCLPTPGSTSGPFNVSWTTPGAKTITLTANTPGCGTTTATVQVNVNSAPSASIISPTATTTCTGTPVSFHGSGNGTSFAWSCDGCTPSPPSTLGPFNASWSSPGNKTITLTANQLGCGSASTATVVVTVLNGTGASIISPTNATTCVNTNVNLQAVSGGATYTWNCDNCTPLPSGTAGPHSVQWSTAGTKTVTVTVTNPGCPTTTATVFVTVNSLPTANIISPTPTIICTGNTVSLQAASGASTYTWNCDGCNPAPSNTAGSFTISWTTSGTKTITLQASNPGCAAVSASPVIITVNPNITATILSPSSNTFCQNTNVTLNATPGATSYGWTCGDCSPTPAASSGPFTVSWPTAGVKTIQLNVNNVGCGSSTATVVVTVNSVPTTTILGPLSAVCTNNNVTLQASNTSLGVYTWNCDGCIGLGSGAGPHSVSWNTPGTKTVTLSAVNAGCVPFVAAPLLVTVNEAPTAVITQPAPANTCVNQIVNMAALPGADVYTWNCDGCIGTVNNTAGPFAVSWNSTGIKTIQLQAANTGCPPVTALAYLVTVDAALNPGISVSPASGVCPNSLATLSVTGGPFPGATYSWNLGGGGTPNSSLTATPTTASWATPGLKVVTVTVTKGGCSYSATQVVNVHTVPEVPIPGSIAGRCGPGPITLSALPGPGGNLVNWYLDEDATVPVATGLTFTSQPISTNTIFYFATQNSVTGCQSPKAAITGHVYEAPAPPITQSITRCGPGEISFSVTMGNPAGKSVALYAAPSGGTPLDYDLSPEFILSTYLHTTAQYYIEAIDSSGLCPSSRVAVMAQIVNKPATPIVQDKSICGEGKVRVQAFMANPPGEELRIFASTTGGVPLQTANTSPFYFEFDVTTTTTFFVESYSATSGCSSEVRAPLVIYANVPPPPPYVADISRCTQGQVTFTVEGLSAEIDRIYVYTSENSQFPVAIGNSLPFLYSSNVATTTTFYFESYNSRTGCRSNKRSKAVAILQGAPFIGVVQREVARCGRGVLTFTIQLQNASSSTQLYLRDRPEGIIWAAASTSPFLLTTPPISTHSSYYIEAIDNATGCSSGVWVQARVDKQPATPNVLPIPSSCDGKPVIIRATNGIPSGDEFALYTTPVGGEPIEVRPNGLMPFTLYNVTSNTTYYVSSRSGNCESARVPVYITLTRIPAPNISGVTRCGAGNVRLTANVFVSGGEVRLYDQMEGGTILTSSRTYPFELILPFVTTNTTYYASVFHPTKECESIRVPVEVKILGIPELPNVPSIIARCGAGSVTITASFLNPIVGYTLRLYDTPQGSIPLQIDSIAPYQFTINNITSSTAFFIETVDRNNPCVNRDRARVLVEILSPPAVPQTLPTSRCGPGLVTLSTFMGVPRGTSMLLYTVATGGSPLSVSYDFPYTFANILVNQTTTFYVASALENCESKRSELVVTVLPLPSAPQAGNSSRCGTGRITLSVIATEASEIEIYESEDDSTPIQTISQEPYLISLSLTTTQTYYVASRNSYGCLSNRVPVELRVHPIPQPVPLPNSRVCGGAQSVTISVIPSQGHELQIWSSNPLATSPIASTANCRTAVCSITLPLNGTQNTFLVVNRNIATGCQSTPSRFMIFQYTPPGEPIAENQRVCQQGSFTFTARMSTPLGTELRLYTQANGGQPILVEQATEAILSTSVNLGSSTYYVAAYDAQTGCESSRRPVVISVSPSLSLGSIPEVKVCEGKPLRIPINLGFSSSTVSVRLFTSASAADPIAVQNQAPYMFVLGPALRNTTYFVDAYDASTGCMSNRVSLEVKVFRNPVAPSVPRIEACGSAPITFTVAQPEGGTVLRLYTHAVEGSPIQSSTANPSNFTLSTTTLNASYYLSNYNPETGCESERIPLNINAMPVPGVPVVNNSTIRLCRPGNAVIEVNMGTSIGSALRLYNVPIGGQPIAQVTSPYIFTLQNQTSNTTYYVEAVNGNCASPSRAAVAVIVDPNAVPPAPTASDLRICTGSSAAFTLAGVPLGATALLYVDANGGSPLAIDATEPYTLAAPMVNTTTTFYLASRIGDCESSVRTPVVLYVEPRYSVPSAAPVVRCGAGPVVLTLNLGSMPAPQVQLFSVPSGGVALASGTQTITIPMVNQTTVFYLEAGQGSNLQCNKQRGAVTVQVIELPTNPTINNIQTCVNSALTITLNPPAIPGAIYQLYSASSGGTPITYVSSLPWQFHLPPQTHTSTYYVQTIVNGCTSASRTSFVVQVFQPAAPPVVSPNPIQRCGAGMVSFTINNNAGEVRVWDANNQLIQALNNPPYVVSTGIVTNSTTFAVRSFNRETGCWSHPAQVRVQIQEKPVPPIAHASAVCPGNAATIAVTSPSTGNYTLRLFSQASGGSLLSSSNLAPYVLNTPPLSVNAIYYLEVMDNVTGCTSERSTVTVQVENAPPAPVASNIELCRPGSTTITVNASPGSIVRLYSLAVGGSALDEKNSAPYTFVLNVSHPTTYYVSSTSGRGCESIRTAVVVNMGSNIVTTASGVTRCGAGVVTFTAFTTSPNGVALYSDMQSDIPLAISTSEPYLLSSPFPVVTTTTFYVQALGNSNCRGERIGVVANILPIPSAPIANNVAICEGSVAILSASMGLVPGRSIGLYEATNVGGRLIATVSQVPYIFSIPNLRTTTRYYLIANNGTCESERSFVEISVMPRPATPTYEQITTCAGRLSFSPISLGSPSGNMLRLYTVANAGVAEAEATQPPFSFTVSVTTSTTYYVESVLGNCSSTRVPVVINVIPELAVPTISPLRVCAGETVSFTVAAPAGSTVKLYTHSMAQVPVSQVATPPYFLSTPPLMRSTELFVEIENGNCRSQRAPMRVIVVPKPAAPFAQHVERCGPGSVSFTVQGQGNVEALRFYGENGTILQTIQAASAIFETPVIHATTTFYVTSLEGECESPRLPVVATINVCESACEAPKGLFITNGSSTSLELLWGAVNNAVCYQISYRPVEDEGRTEQTLLIPAPSTTASIQGLMPATNYIIRIRANCSSCSRSIGTFSREVAIEVNTPRAKMFREETKVDLLYVYPNPSKGTFTLSMYIPTSVTLMATLWDTQGRQVMQLERELEEGYQSIDLDLQYLPSGVYFMQYQFEGRIGSLRLVKE
ncbi:MAG: T9SS type A sorting domain-containing protein [Bacteroidia bacterium]|nr:T9SS type A sorting domain-containing protein [Bacteroidia bacterium]